MRRPRSEVDGLNHPPQHEDRRRSEAGDTLVEILIALTVIGIAATALLLAFATSISGSGEHRNLATFDTMLRTASAEASSLIQQQSRADFTNCSGAYLVNQQGIPLPNAAAPAANPYSASITGVQYWNAAANPPAFTSLPWTPTTSCPSGVTGGGPQLLTVTVTYNGSSGTTSSSLTTAVDDPLAPPPASSCGDPATKLVWVSQPGNGSAGSALYPAPTLVLEDQNGCVEQTDASQVTLGVASGPGTLTNCVPSLLYGETTFQNCTLGTPGTYTLGATDVADGITTPVLSNSFIISQGAPAKLVFSTQPGNGTGGSPLSTQPIVSIEDANGNVVPGDSSIVTLAIGTNPGGGTLSGCTGTSNGNGVVSFAGCKIDKIGTGYTLTATDAADNLTTASAPSNPFNITPGPAFQLAFTTSPASSVAQDPFGTQPVVTLLDAGGNVATGSTDTVKLAIGNNPSAGTLSGCSETTTAGVANFSGCTINNAGTGYTLVATDTTNPAVLSTTSSPFNVAAQALTSFQVSNPGTQTAGHQFSVTITAEDQAGYKFTGYTGAQTLTFSGPSSSPNPATAPSYPAGGTVTFSGGVGTALVTLYNASNTTNLTVAQGTASGSTGSFTVSPAAALNFTVAGFTSPTTAGASHNVTVTAYDTYGNVATGYAGTVHFTSSDAQATLPANTTLSSGTRTFSATLKTAGTQSITATDTVTSTITGTQSGITVNPAGASTFTVSGYTSPTTAGASHNLTVTAYDTYGNVATGYAGTVHFTSSDAQATLPANTTLSSGTGTFSATLKTAGTQSITATDTVTGTITGTQSGITVNPAGANKLGFVQQPTTTQAGSAISPAVTVQVQDTYGNAVADSGATVTMSVNSGPGSFTGGSTTSATTNASGLTTFNNLVLDTSGSYTLQAASSPLTSATSNSVTVNPASATHFTVTGFTSPTTAGASHNLTVTAYDTYGNVATGYAGTVHFTSSDAQATLPANTTLTNGTGTFSATLKTAGTQSITATDTVTGTITGTQSGITVNPAGANKLGFVQQPTTTQAGSAISPAVTVQVQDTYGNAVADSGATVTMSVNSGPGSFTGGSTTSATTNASGLATFNNLVLDTSGSYTLQGASSLLFGTSGSFTVNPLSATHFTVTGFTSPTTAGASHNVTVTAYDTYGNVATGYAGTVHFTSSDAQATLPANTTLTNGTGTFSATLKTAGSQSITATDTVTSTITGTQSNITVNPAGASTFTVAGYPSPTTAGGAHNFTVTAQDAYGNVATGYAGTVHFTSSDAQATLPANTTLTNGTGTFSATLKTAGTQSITATDTVTSTITGSQSISVLSSTATHLTVSGFTNPTTAGAAHNVTVTAYDAYGNVATGYLGTVHFTSSDAQATLPANYTFTSGTGADNGVHTFTNGATLTTAGSQSITATDTVTSTITGTQSGITVNPAAASSFTVSGFTSPTTAGASHNVTVTAYDTYGNVATGYGGTVHFTSSDPQATLPANTTLTNGTKTFSATLKTAGSQSITATDTVTSTITGTQSGITVNPAGASSFTVSGFTSPTTAGAAHNVTVTAHDAYGNVATGYAGTVHFTSSDAQATLPANTTLTNGTGTFSATLTTAGTQSITATDTVTSTITGTQSGITVTPASATHFTVAGFTTPTTAGASHNVTLTAYDTYGNVATGYAGTVHFTSSDGQATLPANTTLTNGTGTFSAALKTAGSQSITATDTVTSTITGTQSGITVNPAGASTFTVSGYPSPTTAGASHNLTVTAYDTYGNVATGYAGTVHFTSSDAQATLPANTTLTNGTGTFSATLKTAGTQSITATDTVTGTITGTQSGITVNPAGANKLGFVQQPTTTQAGSAISPAVTVQVQDTYGNAVADSGATVTMSVNSGPGSFTGGSTTSATTNASGLATFNNLVLDTSGSYTLQGASSLLFGTSGSFTVNPLSATHFTVTGFTSPTTAGASHNVTVTTYDTYGNVATGYAGTVHFTSSDAQATLPANTTLTNGTGTFSATLKTAGSQSITATDTVTSTITGTQSNITVNPAGASTFTVAGYPSPTTAGGAHNFTVTAQDAYGNVATGYAGTVHFTSSDAQATLPANTTLTNGTGTFSATLKTAGTQSITATDTVTSTITGSQSISVLSSTATHLTVSGFTNPTTAGAAHNVTVTAYDAYGNVATGYLGTVHFTSSDAQATLPANYTFTSGTGADNGVHTFTNGATLTTAGSQSITATDTVTSTITGTQSGITVNPAAASSFTVSGFTSPTTAGASHNVTVTAYDTYGNVATGYGGTVHFTSSDPQATLPANTTLTNGTKTFSATLKTAGSQSITATDTVTSTITGTQSGITVNPAGASSFTVSGFTSPTTAGAAHNVTVTAHDAYGNVATGYAGTVHFTSSDAQATLPANTTLTNGTGTFSATLKTAGSQSITATDTVTSTITGTQSGITVNPGAVAGIGLENITNQPIPSLTCTGAVGSISCTSTGEGNLNGFGNQSARTATANIQLEDAYGNAVTNSGTTVTVTVAASGSYQSFSPSSGTLTIPNGSFATTGQFNLVRSSGSSKTATMTASVGGVTELTVTLAS